MVKPRIRQNDLQFDYFSENYRRFEEDFYEYSTIGLPLTFITDDLLMSMAGSQKNYFILNRYNALDQRDHYFIFKVKMVEGAKMIRTYEYIGHQMSI